MTTNEKKIKKTEESQKNRSKSEKDKMNFTFIWLEAQTS